MSTERLMMRVVRAGELLPETGVFIPADEYSKRRMRERAYRAGDLLLNDITKPRNPAYHRLAHRLGKMCVENVDEFALVDAHEALKRCQLDAGVACETALLEADHVWPQVVEEVVKRGGEVMHPALSLMGEALAGMRFPVKLPKSLSYASMDQGEFHEAYRALCCHIGQKYFGGMKPEEVHRMTEAMPDD